MLFNHSRNYNKSSSEFELIVFAQNSIGDDKIEYWLYNHGKQDC